MGKAAKFNRQTGEKLRNLRLLRGISQQKLGKLAGVTFQQIQKYENGANGISLGRPQLCAEALNVTIDHFLTKPEIEVPSIDLSDRKLLDVIQALQRLQERHPTTFTLVCVSLSLVETKEE